MLGLRAPHGISDNELAHLHAPSHQHFDDANVAYRAVAERLQRLLIAWPVMRGDGLVEARKHRHHDALLKPGLEGGVGGTAAEMAHAVRRRRRHLDVDRDLVRGLR
jgi:hypothetical protein